VLHRCTSSAEKRKSEEAARSPERVGDIYYALMYNTTMHAKPLNLIGRGAEWAALERLLDMRAALGIVYGARRSGKSYLLAKYCEAAGGLHYQAVQGTQGLQLDDLGDYIGRHLGVGRLRFESWSEAFEQIARLTLPILVIDEFSYLVDTSPDLASIVQRHVDRRVGPTLVLCGSAVSSMTALVEPTAPLFGRSVATITPPPLAGRDLMELWGLSSPQMALYVDSAVGGLPGYRPLLRSPRGVDSWMTNEVLAASSPLLDAAEASFADIAEVGQRGPCRSILWAVAQGNTTPTRISTVCGIPATALPRPLRTLERVGLLARVPDPVRTRRDRYELADPYLRFWLSIIQPARSQLLAGRSDQIWNAVRSTTWPAQIVGPRWESLVRSHVAGMHDGAIVGATVVSSPTTRKPAEVDVIAVRDGAVVAIGEAKLRRMGTADAVRLSTVRDALGMPGAQLILASAKGFDARIPAAVLTIGPSDVYG
jgi:uncharacterized protein